MQGAMWVESTAIKKNYYTTGSSYNVAGRTRVGRTRVSSRWPDSFPPGSLSSETSTRARGWLSSQLAVRATARN